MTYKQINASREARLWIGQVIVPACAAVTMVLANKNVREGIVAKTKIVKNFVKNKFKRKGA